MAETSPHNNANAGGANTDVIDMDATKASDRVIDLSDAGKAAVPSTIGDADDSAVSSSAQATTAYSSTAPD